MTNQAVPRLGSYAGPSVFRYGFRPFFLGASIWAIVAIFLWMGILHGGLDLPTASPPVLWHTHELLFGYLTAAVAGFLLTAIPNWTGQLPLRGWPLAALAALWLAGRVAVAASATIGPFLAAAIDLSFLAVLLMVVLREILSGKNWRNLPMVVALLLLLVANALTHLGPILSNAADQYGIRLGIATITMLIALIGGRIIPSFTRNWLKKRGAAALPAGFGTVDRLALLATLIAMIAWIALPDTTATGWMLVLVATAHAYRMSCWRPGATLAEPLLAVLHLGYAWLPLAFLLLGFGALGLVSATAGLHALTVGAMGTMTLAVMTRATLGHTGRELKANSATTAIFVLITFAAITRVLASLFLGTGPGLINISSVFWILAFGLFVGVYGPILLRPAQSGLRT